MNASHFFFMTSLGYGNYRTTHIVRRKADNMHFVIKAQKLISPDFYQMLKNEIPILCSIRHINIISYLSIWFEDDYIFCVLMEYVSGVNLHTYLYTRPHPLFENDAIRLFYQVVAGVDYIHKKAIIHRNLKPTNIMLCGSEKNFVRIGDFSLSKYGVNYNASETDCNLIYMAPEVLSGASYNSKCDIWSLGIILYEMLTKTYPFRFTNIAELTMQITQVIMTTSMPNISLICTNLIYAMLSVHPESRPSPTHIMLHQIIYNNINVTST